MSKESKPVESKEVAVSEYKALSGQGNSMGAVLANNLNGQQLRPFDLDRVVVPSGGATTWEVPSIKGPESTRELVGIILAAKDGRQYWEKKAGDGGNTPPDCSSSDLIHGVGHPGGDCQACAFNLFGSARDANGNPGKGKACKESKLMFFIRPGDILPLAISVPATSLSNARKYFLRLAQSQLMYQSVVTKLTLKREQGGGNPYAEIEFTYVRDLTKEEEARSIGIAQTLKDTFSKVDNA